MKISDLKANPANPRKISDGKLQQLQKSLAEFGDISGIVFNRTTGNLVGGHQRNKSFDRDTEVTITKHYEKPTKSGTVAIGFIRHEGERYAYREVEWDKYRETGAGIAANKNAGDWDTAVLTEQLKELGSFDVNFDLDLTMFDIEERKFYDRDDRKVNNTSQEIEIEGLTRYSHSCPKCGFTFNTV